MPRQSFQTIQVTFENVLQEAIEDFLCFDKHQLLHQLQFKTRSTFQKLNEAVRPFKAFETVSFWFPGCGLNP